jgi:aminoglycoside phosphotransferase (APT) family kinase protein
LSARLHRLSASGQGRLVDRAGPLMGRAGDALAGAAERFPQAWPFGERALADHAIARLAPDLVSPLSARQAAILAAAGSGPFVAVHSDLNRGNILIRDGGLAGLIDFGDVIIANPAWDVACFAFFHDWARVGDFLEGYGAGYGVGYGAGKDAAAKLMSEARTLSIAFALQHAGRGDELGDPERVERAVGFLRRCLEED